MALRVETGDRATWYVATDLPLASIEPVLARLRSGGVRAVRSCLEHPGCTPDAIRNVMRSCSRVVIVQDAARTASSQGLARELEAAAALGREVTTIAVDDSASVLPQTYTAPDPDTQPYAFVAVRIHDDFALVREAIITSVEQTLGIPCLWFDDPRLVTDIVGVRRRTQEAIRGAALVVADLTYGPDNPRHDSPNTAHEIGMALAYERPVIVTCQVPRRDLYFSAGDLTTIFWRDEEDLHRQLTAWLEPIRGAKGRAVLNGPPAQTFAMDVTRRYIAPKPLSVHLRSMAGVPRAVALLTIALLATLLAVSVIAALERTW